MRILTLLTLSILVTSQTILAETFQENPKIAALFTDAGIEGTFTAYSPANQTLQGHDADRAAKRFIPTPTFQIANTIIGLETGAVANIDEVLPYGGKPQPLKIWERDMSLREAIRISNVAIFQELARRAHLAPMQEWLTRLDYGNAKAGDVVDRFWLDGPLEISAIEQTKFLARLATGQLPIKKSTLDQVIEITTNDVQPEYTLHAKTGWLEQKGSADLGWWVGWVESHGTITSFALNLDMPKDENAEKRVRLGRRCLTALGILPETASAKP